MPGQQIFIYQKNNKLINAAIAADVSPSARPPLIYPVRKRGNGNIRMYGQYNGAVDAKYDVKIIDTALEVPIVSAPTFKGAGTGKISGIAVSGLQAQKMQILCTGTGTDTTQAEIEIEGLIFQARGEGSPGNAIYIIVDDSFLTFTQTDYSLIKALKAGDTALEGQEWDFDTKVMQGSLIPTDAHRIAFGLDRLHIYLQYKKFEDGKWLYYFVPEIKYNVAAGSRVYNVTGGRKITVTNGIDTEEYTNIVSIADFWQKVKDNSSLLEPKDSSIDTTRNPSSPAVREFATKTDAYFLPPYKAEGSSEYAGELESIIVNNNAKTELLKLECVDNAYVGAEIWDVKGSSSGEMGQAKTGEIANFGQAAFLIPQKFPKDWGKVNEDWSYKVTYAGRGAGIDPPAICFAMRLGINSAAQTLTLTYKKKPAECSCPQVSFNDKCLGFEEKGGEIGMAYTVPDLLFWTDVVFERMKEKIKSNFEPYEGRSRFVDYGAGYSFGRDAADYFSDFKVIAQRITNLTEDSPSQLQSLVDNYKSLVNSVNLLFSGGKTLTWDGAAWTGDGYISYTTSQIWDVSYDTDLKQTLVDALLLYERTYGVKKNSIVAAGSCYIDAGGDYYWEVHGAKAYMPAFTDTPYYSTVKKNASGSTAEEYVNTKEFAFLISTPCGGALVEGDIIEVSINGSVFERTYQLGDITYLPTIAAQNLYLTGGIDGDDLYTFDVKGDINSFPDYTLDRDNPQRYYQSQLSFMITDGIVPFQIGDVFEFAIEGGRFVWRKDSGAWSSPLNIEQEIQALDSGLQIGFDFGVSPSFVQNDSYEVLCEQENRIANLTAPQLLEWKGTGNIVFTFPAAVTVDALIIDLHDLTGTITFQASNDIDFDPLLHNEVITVSDLICKLYMGANVIEAKYFRLLISGEHSIGYIFLGSLMQFTADADAVRPLKRYKITRQETRVPFDLTDFMKQGFTVEYSSFINSVDWAAFVELFDYLKVNNNQPFYFIPNYNYPGNCIRGTIEIDNLEPGSDIDYNAPEAKRLYNFPFSVVGTK
jgi:hypothetical protein